MGALPVAMLALLAFVPLAVIAFGRLPRSTAAAGVILVGIVFLPEGAAWDFPILPPLGKEYVTCLGLLLGALIYRYQSLVRARLGFGPEALLVLMFLANITSVATNQNAMWDEGRLEPGRGLWALIAQTGDDILGIGLPFFLGRALFSTREDLRVLMRMLVAVGLAYTALITVEVAMSIPFKVFQISRLIYGISMQPQWRWGVIQPVVFMDNGLAVAAFMAAALIAAAGLAKARLPVFRVGAKRSVGILWFGLLMTRNVAGNVYGAALTLASMILSSRMVATIAIALVSLACTYPALRMADLFPYREIVAFAASFDAERARSLGGRFDEEDLVLEPIDDRLWFGWGTYERIPDAETFGGKGGSGLDGWWIIRLGTSGIVGVELQYAMFAWPVLLAGRRLRRFGKQDAALLAALMAIVSMRAVDLIINGWWDSLPVFYAGALYGLAGSLPEPENRENDVAADEPPKEIAPRLSNARLLGRR